MKINASMLKYGVHFIRQYGVKTLLIRYWEKKREDAFDYQKIFFKNRVTEEELQKQRRIAGHWEGQPLVSIVTPLFHTPEAFLQDLLESVLASSYENWEICLVDATPEEQGEKAGTIAKTVQKYQTIDEKLTGRTSRIRYRRLSENFGISENTNRAIEMTEGDYIAFLDHDDVITPDALYEMILAVKQSGTSQKNAVMIYSDEDKMNEDRTRYYEPHFKTDFNPDLLCSNNYITHFLMVSRTLLEKTGGIRKEFDGAQDYDFILRCTEKAEQVFHVPKVLYHWRVHKSSTAGGGGSKDYAICAGKHAIEAHLQRTGVNGEVIPTPYFGFYRVDYEKGKDKTVFTVDLNRPVPLEKMEGEYIIFWDASMHPVQKDWKEILLSDCAGTGAGVVGGRILDRKHRILEACYLKNTDAEESKDLFNDWRGQKSGFGGYMHRANLQLDCDAVSGKCMIVKKEILESMGDDLTRTAAPEFGMLVCEAAKKLGYRIMYEPKIEMRI